MDDLAPNKPNPLAASNLNGVHIRSSRTDAKPGSIQAPGGP
ncbi:hypothetical protein LA76x_4455 [Lysobacter antibioticus]|uniref:Uncharacterized protein n=1 Tax=Lysobacter antibioticus TaxID=84531 RepID=A0A0S2FG91_LYSAN|nr:hypothetical protein LA76x_4455 [Lysobacter antibioticus]